MSNTETANPKKTKNKNLSVTLTPWRWGGGGTPKNHWRGVSPGSPHPDPISDQNMSFSTPVLRPDL